MIKNLIQIAREAGKILLGYYGDKNFTLKEDRSPLTQADQASHRFISNALRHVKNVPILSEEKPISYRERLKWSEFWLIDPLDGTREFIQGCNEFCINIALITNNKPTIGLIYAPALDELYYAIDEYDFHYIGRPREDIKKDSIRVAVSRFHHNKLTQKFIDMNNIEYSIRMGSALKFGRIALGEIDLYPRFEGSKEWDIAAGQVILNSSGGIIVDITTRILPTYNKPKITNNHFIAYGPRIDFKKLVFSEKFL